MEKVCLLKKLKPVALENLKKLDKYPALKNIIVTELKEKEWPRLLSIDCYQNLTGSTDLRKLYNFFYTYNEYESLIKRQDNEQSSLEV